MTRINAVDPSFTVMTDINRGRILKQLEQAIRVCYKSEDRISEDSHVKIVEKVIDSNHLSTIEHENITVRFVCNRGFTHELVRHRLASFSQESTRYCNYSKDKFGNSLTFIRPANFDIWTGLQQNLWLDAMKDAEASYLAMIEAGAKAQDARGVLPIDIKTEIVMTTNLRHWREVLKQRTSPAAHPSMRQLMVPLHEEFMRILPEIFTEL